MSEPYCVRKIPWSQLRRNHVKTHVDARTTDNLFERKHYLSQKIAPLVLLVGLVVVNRIGNSDFVFFGPGRHDDGREKSLPQTKKEKLSAVKQPAEQ